MKSKLKIIIPIGIAIIAIALAFVFIRFTQAQKTDIKAIISTAQQYITEQKFEQAIAEFEKAIQMDPNNIDAYIGIAQAYEAIGDTGSALEWLHKGYDLTGDSSLKAEIDRISGLAEEVVTAAEGTATEPSSNAKKFLEKKIVYADNWYSILKYDENENIICMDLYTSSDQKRLSVNYEYSDSLIKRTVYVDDVLYEEGNVTFSDIMAEVEAEKKKRANTTERSDSNWWVYDENGECIEYGWNDLNSDGNITTDSGGEEYYRNGIICKSHAYYPNSDSISYYDENGYPVDVVQTFNDEEIRLTFTYDYDDYGYPIIWYYTGEIVAKYVNIYKNDRFLGAIEYTVDSASHYFRDDVILETADDGKYIRKICHSFNRGVYDFDGGINIYYIPSYDETKIIDQICIEGTNNQPLFGCPFCYEEN